MDVSEGDVDLGFPFNLGALIIRIGFGCILSYTYNPSS